MIIWYKFDLQITLSLNIIFLNFNCYGDETWIFQEGMVNTMVADALGTILVKKIKNFNYWYSHYKDKTVLRLSHLYNVNSYSG